MTTGGFGLVSAAGVMLAREAEAIVVVGDKIPVTSQNRKSILRRGRVGCHHVDQGGSFFAASRAAGTRREVKAPNV